MLAVDHMLRWQWIVHLRPYAVWGMKRIRRDCRLLIRTALLGLIAGSVSGCAVGPHFAPPAAPDVGGYVPGKLASPNPGAAAPRIAGQHFVTGADVSARWWSAFKSPLLNQLVKQSVDHNPNLQAAEALDFSFTLFGSHRQSCCKADNSSHILSSRTFSSFLSASVNKGL